MTDTDFLQPDLGPLRAAAEAAELVQAVSGLVRIDGCRLADSDPLAPLARDVARSMTEAGLTVHHCARHHPLYRLGGVCLLAVPAGPADSHAGIAVSWTAHNLLLLDWDRYGTYIGTQQAMNTALGGVGADRRRRSGPHRCRPHPLASPAGADRVRNSGRPGFLQRGAAGPRRRKRTAATVDASRPVCRMCPAPTAPQQDGTGARMLDDGQLNPQGGHAELPGGGQRDYFA
jgi:hypothetical protein